jgi:hypothetical protein
VCIPNDPGTNFQREPAQLFGSQLDKFLRRCLIACGQMMFENIIDLYTNYSKYRRSEPYLFAHSTL